MPIACSAASATAPTRPEDTADRVELVFLAQAALTPHATALEWSAGRMSYDQLRHRAQLLAAGPLGRLSAADELVALCLARGPALVVAVLGTLLASGAFLPIDPATPPLRMESMLDDAQPVLVLFGEQRHEAVLRAANCAAPLVLIDADGIVNSPSRAPAEVETGTAAARSAARSGARSGACSGADLMYVIFTSGSTGRPKGAPACQSALARCSPCGLPHFQKPTRMPRATHWAGEENPCHLGGEERLRRRSGACPTLSIPLALATCQASWSSTAPHSPSRAPSSGGTPSVRLGARVPCNPM